MSYIRWGEDGSDVYVIHTGTYYECLGCPLTPSDEATGLYTVEFPTYKRAVEMFAHLNEHRLLGHTVPDRPFDRLKEDIKDGK